MCLPSFQIPFFSVGDEPRICLFIYRLKYQKGEVKDKQKQPHKAPKIVFKGICEVVCKIPL
jgi:hypothetical protein